MCVCVQGCVGMCVCACVYVGVCVHVCTCVCVCMCMSVCVCLWRSGSTGLVPHSLAGEGRCVQGESAETIPGFSQYSLPPSQCISVSLSLRLLETPRVSTRQGRSGGFGGSGGIAALKQEVGLS